MICIRLYLFLLFHLQTQCTMGDDESLFCQDETIAKFYYNIVNGLPLLTMDKTKFKIQYID